MKIFIIGELFVIPAKPESGEETKQNSDADRGHNKQTKSLEIIQGLYYACPAGAWHQRIIK